MEAGRASLWPVLPALVFPFSVLGAKRGRERIQDFDFPSMPDGTFLDSWGASLPARGVCGVTRPKKTNRLLEGVLFSAVLWALSFAAATAEEEDAFGPIAWAEVAPLAPKSLLVGVARFDSTLLAVGERGHVLVSEDGGASWTQAKVPTRSLLTAVATIEGGRAWAVGHDAVILHSTDGGRSWTRQYFAPDEGSPLLDVWFENANHGIAVGAYALYLETEDGGETWEGREVDEEERHWNAIAHGLDGTLYVAAESGVVFRSVDKGRSWEMKETPYRGSFLGCLCLSNGAVLVYGLRGNVYRSTDRGESWQHIPTDQTVTLMGGTQTSDGSVVIVGLSGTLLVSEDEGLTFRSMNRPDRQALGAAVQGGPGRLLLFGENGVSLLEEVLKGSSS